MSRFMLRLEIQTPGPLLPTLLGVVVVEEVTIYVERHADVVMPHLGLHLFGVRAVLD